MQATATLTHPNTVEIYDYGHADDGTFYYVMEYLPGLTLEELVERHGPLPPGRAVHLLRQVCGALREAHAIGLIHRDIKPGNIIVCQRGGVADDVPSCSTSAWCDADRGEPTRREADPGGGDRRHAGVHVAGAGRRAGRARTPAATSTASGPWPTSC